MPPLRDLLRHPVPRVVAVAHLLVLAWLVCLGALLRGHEPSLRAVARWTLVEWDARHYVAIAERGYGEPHLASFFPLFPLASRAAGVAAGGPLGGALLVSGLAHVAAGWLLYHLVRSQASPRVARDSVLLLLAFPAAFVAVLPYTESLFLALCLGCLLAARDERPLAAGLLGALACMTRLNGVALVGALAVEYVVLQRGRRSAWRSLAAASLPACGLVVHLALNWAVYGSPFQFLGVLQGSYEKVIAWPHVGLVEELRTMRARRFPEYFTVGVCNLLGTALAWAGAAYAVRRMRASDAAFAVLSALLISVQSWWLSSLRYAYVIPAVHVALAAVRRPAWLRALVVGGCLALQAVLAVQFARARWAF